MGASPTGSVLIVHQSFNQVFHLLDIFLENRNEPDNPDKLETFELLHSQTKSFARFQLTLFSPQVSAAVQ